MLEVRESNVEARRLYETLGFRAVGVKRNYYKKEKEDAVLMRFVLDRGGTGEVRD
jgi:ribosomal-protein-alanine N-acetyltransferase